MNNITWKILSLVIAYFLGAIPFGFIIAKAKGIDLQRTGSGNTGATNVYRSVGKVWGNLVFLLDFFKGYLACKITSLALGANAFFWISISAIFVILGHTYSIFLKGKGGKGVATGAGVLGYIAPFWLLIGTVMGLIIIRLTGFVSLASLIISLFLAIILTITKYPLEYVILFWLLALLVWYKHLPNIRRLMLGKELKIR